jgi:membrane-associated phospholipid phosphatase
MLLIAELAGPRMITIGALITALALTVMRRWHWLLSLVDYGFPSGHTMIATLFYGYLALFLVKTLSGWRWRALVMIIVGGLIMLIGLSRMYLGVHYLSDVLAAMAAGVAWLVLCVTAVATLGHRRR